MLSLDTIWATIKIILPILSLVNIISSLTVCLSTHLSAAQGTQCKFSHFLASVGACNLILHIHVLVNNTCSGQYICQNRVSADQYHMTILWSQVPTHWGYMFFGSYQLTVTGFQLTIGSTPSEFLCDGYKFIVWSKL